ncbi:uncharacterized protein LOC121987295 [Zingiber officinale]|uniref:uncharacterized protein LOC121987295 n=1 Tax=Zingiber officinale TaxID=94328 RepID=UPI001C4C68F2|nr:uncharacterized protein LOC121987295 [Zingiber officinale]
MWSQQGGTCSVFREGTSFWDGGCIVYDHGGTSWGMWSCLGANSRSLSLLPLGLPPLQPIASKKGKHIPTNQLPWKDLPYYVAEETTKIKVKGRWTSGGWRTMLQRRVWMELGIKILGI